MRVGEYLSAQRGEEISDSGVSAACPGCGKRMTLADARFEEHPDGSVYECDACGARLAALRKVAQAYALEVDSDALTVVPGD